MEAEVSEYQVAYKGPQRLSVQRALPHDLEPLCDWCDLHLAGDYFFRRKHLAGVLARPLSATWVIRLDGVVSGLVILYRASTLHNLYLSPDCRNVGVGAAIVAHFAPTRIRAKTNMLAGDPVPFYVDQGYRAVSVDPRLPHIVEMRRDSTAADNSAAPPPAARSIAPLAATPPPLSADPPQSQADLALHEAAARWHRRKLQQTAARARRRARDRAEDAAVAASHLPAPAPPTAAWDGHAPADNQIHSE